jgi:hypothetical protein
MTEDEKSKDKGDIKNTLKIRANAVQFLNGEICSRNSGVPIVLLDYTPPTTAHPFAKGERFALWIKLEGSEHREIQVQLRKDLRELTIWFDYENRQKILEFLKQDGGMEDGQKDK